MDEINKMAPKEKEEALTMKKGFVGMQKTAALQRYAACFTKAAKIGELISEVIAAHSIRAMEAVQQQFFLLLWSLYSAEGSFYPDKHEVRRRLFHYSSVDLDCPLLEQVYPHSEHQHVTRSKHGFKNQQQGRAGRGA